MKKTKMIVRNQRFSTVITIPAEICKTLGIQVGKFMEAKQLENGVLFTPIEVIPKNN
jgi:hypothetical protein